MIKDLPLFKLDIVEDEESNIEVDFVALVDKPAIEKSFLAFNEQRKFKFAVNEEKQIITGALMLADTPIYRNDTNGEYLVVFDAPTIEKIAQKFFAKGFQNNVNIQHDSGQIVSGLSMFESWIVDSKRGIMPLKGFEDVPEGSWFGSMKVNNDEVWQMVKSGEVKGFSVEGTFQYKKTGITNPIEMMNQINDILSQIK